MISFMQTITELLRTIINPGATTAQSIFQPNQTGVPFIISILRAILFTPIVIAI